MVATKTSPSDVFPHVTPNQLHGLPGHVQSVAGALTGCEMDVAKVHMASNSLVLVNTWLCTGNMNDRR